MALDGSVAPSIISAFSGLIGVAFGSSWHSEASRELATRRLLFNGRYHASL